MNSAVDRFAEQPDSVLSADAALEASIDAAYEAMVRAPTDEASREWFGIINRLILQRSPVQLLKLELERRMRAKAKRG
jgi:hypothetical protein